MNTIQKTPRVIEDVKVNIKIKLSALWVVLMLCYIYADILSLFRPGQLDEMLAGNMGPFPVTEGSLFTATILMAIPAVMVFLSLALKPKANRWTNIVLGVLYTLVNVSNLIGETWAYYLFFGLIEIILTVLIIRFAWKWTNGE